MQAKVHDGDKLTYRDIEDFLAEQGIAVSRVAIRLWLRPICSILGGICSELNITGISG